MTIISQAIVNVTDIIPRTWVRVYGEWAVVRDVKPRGNGQLVRIRTVDGDQYDCHRDQQVVMALEVEA